MNRFQLQKIARRFHKSLAYFVALGLFWFTTTGFLLNHTEDFKLDQQTTHSPWLLKLFHFEPLLPHQLVTLPNAEIITTNYGSFWNQKLILPNEQVKEATLYPFQGMTTYLLLTNQNALYIVTPDGDIIERRQIPISHLCTLKKQIGICTTHQFLTLNHDLSAFEKVNILNEPTTEQLINHQSISINQLPERLLKNWKSPLSWEDLILKMHNGVLFQSIGKWILDIFTFILLLFIISGLILTLKKRQPIK